MRRINHGFTLLELLIVLGITTLLISILLPALSRGPGEAAAVECLSNLKQLGTGFHYYADEHAGNLPDDSNAADWFVLLSAYLPQPRVYQCPSEDDTADQGPVVSYEWRNGLAVLDPATSLAGRKLGLVGQQDLILLFDGIPGWHGDTDVQAAALDTSARRYSHDDFQANLARTVQ